MLTASDFRRYAREALKGRWLKAGGTAIVAGFLGAQTYGGGNFFNSVSNNFDSVSQNSGAGADAVSNIGAASSGVSASLLAGVLGFGLIFMIAAIVIFIISGAMTLGYAKYNLNLVDDKNPQFSDIFSQFGRLGTGLLMVFLRAVYTTLWTMLLVIPGIIAQYRYAMASYILYENPEMTANEAITESKLLMKGNKWRLFCLEFSFIGWILLAALCLFPIIMLLAPIVVMGHAGNTVMTIVTVVLILAYAILLELFLTPYMEASVAVFYREIKNGKYSSPEVEIEVEEDTEAEPEIVNIEEL